MRCPDCNKFVPLTFEEPEVESLECEPREEGVVDVTAEVRIYRNCGECGTEMKEATLSMETTVEIEEKAVKKLVKKYGPWDELEIEIEQANVNQIEEGGGRYAKSYFGAEVGFILKVGTETIGQGTVSDKVPASGMDEMV